MSAKNRRQTKQGAAILNVLQTADHALTANDLLLEVQIAMPTINAATLYRNLHKLEEQGQVNAISVSGKMFFEVATDPHHHFYCHGCGTLLNVSADAISVPKAAELMRGSGYSAEQVSLVVEGMCPNCSGESAPFAACANCSNLCGALVNADGESDLPCAK